MRNQGTKRSKFQIPYTVAKNLLLRKALITNGEDRNWQQTTGMFRAGEVILMRNTMTTTRKMVRGTKANAEEHCSMC